MTSFDPMIADALGRELPLRVELEPAWSDVVARAEERPRRRILASRRVLAGALVAAAGLSLGGLAIADAFGPLHWARLVVNPGKVGGASGISTCRLIGKPAGKVAATLTRNGIGIEWRFTHWGTATATTGVGQPQAVTGGSSDAVSSVPDDSIVWDVSADGRSKAFVFVEAPNDPNAPTVSIDGCAG